MIARRSSPRNSGTRVAPIARNTAAAAQLKKVTTQISTTNPRWDSERLGVITASM